VARKKRTKDGVPGSSGVKASNGAAPPKAAAAAAAGDEALTDAEKRELFRTHKTAFDKAKRALQTAQANLREVKANLKADGFTVRAIEDAILMATPEGEAKVRERLAATIQAAVWEGSDIGTQFTFEFDEVMSSVDRAFDEGGRASEGNQPKKPPHAPGTKAFDSWMAGYDDHQSKLMGGFKPMAPSTDVSNKLN
jgi:uncharacterized membrane protein